MKSLKNWKTIIHFIITVLTAVLTTITTSSCLHPAV
ncbi:MAG: smalltalk protein [Prevotella sp.]|nr:smalltalk protein [Prevotella sp.]